jgi:hypothetical protein
MELMCCYQIGSTKIMGLRLVLPALQPIFIIHHTMLYELKCDE